MKKNILLILGLIFVIAGVAVAYFAKFELADVTGFAITMFGAGLASAQLWQKRDTTKKTWLALFAVVFVGLGAFLLGFGQFSKETMVTVISTVFGLVAIIGGLIVSAIQSKNAKQIE
jgi:hypothetical protein